MADDKKSPAESPAKSPAKSPSKSPGAGSPTAKSPSKSPGAGSPTALPSGAGEETGILPAEHWGELAQIQDAEEDVLSDQASSTASITSSILRYREIRGRRYHSEIGNASYWVANDDKQSESMALNHHSITLQMGNKLFYAPLDTDKIQKVLDVGTGNGLWAIDFADEYENIEVIGTDISPIQPTWIPPNLKFEIEDCSSEWTFSENSFDYIHARWLYGSIADWTALYGEVYKALKPGGWVESHEPSPEIFSEDDTVTPDIALGQWGKIFLEGGKKLGRTFDIIGSELQKKALQEAGFVDIRESDIKSPIGSWPKDPKIKEQGAIQQMAFMADIEGYVLIMSATVGWSREETMVFVAQMRREMNSGKYHPLFRQKIVCGRKPE